MTASPVRNAATAPHASTHVEIASMLGAPVGTVKGRMRLGPGKLREQLQGWETVGA